MMRGLPATPTRKWSREDLQAIASHQRTILICILVYLLTVLGQFLFPAINPVLRVVLLGVGIVATVFVFMLATRFYSTAVSVLLAILTLLPVIGMMALLIVNGKATRTLKANGYSVGLLGAWDPTA
jgi:hypothetical protein